MADNKSKRIKIGMRQALTLLSPYIRDRVMSQIKSVWLIIVYLVLFQTLVLSIPVAQGALIGIGVALVVGGLTFFMEGLVLGLMPLGERVGIRLPQRVGILAVVFFAFLLGLLATMAEPAIQVLQAAGTSVDAWQAPLLFLLLNQYADLLVLSVGGGVGLAVALGMIRFYRSWSLKPLILILVGSLLGVTAWTYFDPNLRIIAGLAWDCGAVTTGPVTVPLVLALGVGISRMVGTSESGTSGFGVVTLASLFPILAVYLLGLAGFQVCLAMITAVSHQFLTFKIIRFISDRFEVFPCPGDHWGHMFVILPIPGCLSFYDHLLFVHHRLSVIPLDHPM